MVTPVVRQAARPVQGVVTCQQLLAHPRQDCELRNSGCEVVTRCVLTPNGHLACPTCAHVQVV